MARLNFRFTPLDTVDFDVCGGPPRPDPAPAEPSAAPAKAAMEPVPSQRAAALPEPAEG